MNRSRIHTHIKEKGKSNINGLQLFFFSKLLFFFTFVSGLFILEDTEDAEDAKDAEDTEDAEDAEYVRESTAPTT